jgi:hypothetical protein
VAGNEVLKQPIAQGDNPWPGNEVLLHPFAQGKLRIGRKWLAGIADNGEPMLQPQLQIRHAAHGRLWRGSNQVSGGGLRCRVRKNVGMRINEAGNDGVAAQIDHRGRTRRRRGADGADSVAGHGNVGILRNLTCSHIDEPAGMHNLDILCRSGERD